MRLYLPDGWHEITLARFWTGLKWASLTRALFYTGTEWKTIATFTMPVTVTVNPLTASGFVSGTTTQAVLTSTVTAFPSGGLGPYSYSWQRISSSGGPGSVATQSAKATTAFSKPGMTPEQFFSDIWQVTVTDSLGQTGTAQATAAFSHLGDFS